MRCQVEVDIHEKYMTMVNPESNLNQFAVRSADQRWRVESAAAARQAGAGCSNLTGATHSQRNCRICCCTIVQRARSNSPGLHAAGGLRGLGLGNRIAAIATAGGRHAALAEAARSRQAAALGLE